MTTTPPLDPQVPTLRGAGGGQVSFTLDGFDIPGWAVAPLLNSGAAVLGPAATTRWQNGRWEFYWATLEGDGWVPGGGANGNKQLRFFCIHPKCQNFDAPISALRHAAIVITT